MKFEPISKNDKRWVIADKHPGAYPIGTKYQSKFGGYWVHAKHGYRFSVTDSVEPMLGPSWTGMVIPCEDLTFDEDPDNKMIRLINQTNIENE